MQENSQTINVGFDPFADENISETAPEATPAPAQVVEETKKETTTEPAKQETSAEVIETPANPIKEKLGFETIEDAAAEMQRLRDSATTKEEIKFANEQSQKLFDYLKEGKIDDVFTLLNTQKKLSGAADMKAADAIRLHLEMTNSHFTADDVQDVFEERYALPEKPQQLLEETDEEFEVREAKWKTQVDKINRKIERDAVVAKRELAKLNSELVLPDIPKKEDAAAATTAATQKELERIDELRNLYQQTLESDFKNFKGYELTYKDEEVEIPLNYAITDEELVAQKEELKDFDIDAFIGTRWFTNGKPNINQIQKDMYMLKNGGKVLQKLVNEAGQKRLEAFLKKQSNITVGESGSAGTFQPSAVSKDQEKTKMAEFFFGN